MNTRQKLTLGIAAIFMITLTIVGVTYAYFVTKVNAPTSPTTVDVETATFGVEYSDGNNLVELKDALPGAKAYKVFQMTNSKSESPIAFNIVISQKAGTTAFVHADATDADTNCFVENPTEKETKCYVADKDYNNIVVTLKKYTGDDSNITTKSQSELETIFKGTENVSALGTTANVKTTGPSQQLASDIIEGKVDEANVVNTYILEVEYKDNGKNQNIENKAELTLTVNVTP